MGKKSAKRRIYHFRSHNFYESKCQKNAKFYHQTLISRLDQLNETLAANDKLVSNIKKPSLQKFFCEIPLDAMSFTRNKIALTIYFITAIRYVSTLHNRPWMSNFRFFRLRSYNIPFNLFISNLINKLKNSTDN